MFRQQFQCAYSSSGTAGVELTRVLFPCRFARLKAEREVRERTRKRNKIKQDYDNLPESPSFFDITRWFRKTKDRAATEKWGSHDTADELTTAFDPIEFEGQVHSRVHGNHAKDCKNVEDGVREPTVPDWDCISKSKGVIVSIVTPNWKNISLKHTFTLISTSDRPRKWVRIHSCAFGNVKLETFPLSVDDVSIFELKSCMKAFVEHDGKFDNDQLDRYAMLIGQPKEKWPKLKAKLKKFRAELNPTIILSPFQPQLQD